MPCQTRGLGSRYARKFAPARATAVDRPSLAERLLEFERPDAAWSRGATALDRARIGQERQQVLSEIVTLRQRIASARAELLADVAVQSCRLVVMAEEKLRPHTLLGPPDTRRRRRYGDAVRWSHIVGPSQ